MPEENSLFFLAHTMLWPISADDLTWVQLLSSKNKNTLSLCLISLCTGKMYTAACKLLLCNVMPWHRFALVPLYFQLHTVHQLLSNSSLQAYISLNLYRISAKHSIGSFLCQVSTDHNKSKWGPWLNFYTFLDECSGFTLYTSSYCLHSNKNSL